VRGFLRMPPLLLAWWGMSLVSALLVYGPYHPDEWGQISQFIVRRLDLFPAEVLPWEYHQQIRSWLQPGLYIALLGPWIRLFGYHHLWVERAMHLIQWGILSLALMALWRVIRDLQPKNRTSYTWIGLTLATLYFAPSMLVRHSSEALSTALLTLSLERWYRVERRDRVTTHAAWVSGALSGLAFFARFQVGFFIAGFWLARLLASRGDRTVQKALSYFAGGLVIASCLSVAIDCWGYGTFVFTPYRYFASNILDDKASSFGVSPWYFYFVQSVMHTLNPFLWIWLAYATVKAWSDPWLRALSVGIFLFFLGHTAVGHKEARFLLPLLAPLTILLLSAFAREERAHPWFFPKPILGVICAAQVAALLFHTCLNLEEDSARPMRSTWLLPKHAKVVASVQAFAPFDRLIAPYTRAEQPFTWTLIRPPDVEFVGAYVPQFDPFCQEPGLRYVMLTNRDRAAEGILANTWVDTSFPSIAEFPWRILRWVRSDAGWYRRMWRFKLVSCSAFLARAPSQNPPAPPERHTELQETTQGRMAN
jgi:hypothetical protein